MTTPGQTPNPRRSDMGVRMPAQGIHEISEDQLYKFGTRFVMGERSFYYAKAGGTALAAGKLMQSPVPATDHTGLAVTTAAAGLTKVTLTNGATTAITADMYKDGWLWCDTGTLVCTAYQIKSHPAAAVNATCEFTLREELAELLTNAQETVSLVRNQYDALIVSPSVPTALVVGIPPVDVTASYYFWLQTYGPCPVLTTDTVVIGNHAAVADDDAGAIQAADTDTEQIVGSVMRVEADTEYSFIFLRCAR